MKEKIGKVGPLVSTCNDLEEMLKDNNLSNKEKKAMGHQALGTAIWRLNNFGKDFTEIDKKEFRERIQSLRDRLNGLVITAAPKIEVPIMGTGFTMEA